MTLFQKCLMLNDKVSFYYTTKHRMYINIWLTESGDGSN